MKTPEEKCPNCGGAIDWKVIRSKYGAPAYNGLCRSCNAVMKGRETPDVAKGRALAKAGKELSRKERQALPGDVELGYLREIQSGPDGYLTKMEKKRKETDSG